MYRIYSIFMFMMMMTETVYSQESSANAKNLVKEGLQKMALFTLTKEEAQYTEGKTRLSEAKAMYNSLLSNAKSDGYVSVYLMGVQVVESYEIIYDQRFKESIQNDREEPKINVTHEGKEYKVSKNQKRKYELVKTSLKSYLN